jgi:predicted HTH transcriptional regulator
MPMTWEEIITLLEQGEGQSVEFEKQVPTPEDLARDMVAFANSDGGKIILGLDDKNKHLVGIEAGEEFKNLVKEIGEKRCSPHILPNVQLIDRGVKKVAVITVLEGDEKPYKADDICYLRDASESRPAKEDEERQITNPWGGKGLNRRQLRSLQLMQERGTISNREYREAFNVSHKTAHIELTMMVDKKIVKSEGSGRSTCYILPPQ